jgi:hypothetical protein
MALCITLELAATALQGWALPTCRLCTHAVRLQLGRVPAAVTAWPHNRSQQQVLRWGLL